MEWVLRSLEEQWTRSDLIQNYKTVDGLESIYWYSGIHFFPDSPIRAATSQPKHLKREVLPSKACYDFCDFFNVRHEFSLNKVTDYLKELTNPHENAIKFKLFQG